MVTFTECLECFDRPIYNKGRRLCQRCYQQWRDSMGGNLVARGINVGGLAGQPSTYKAPAYERKGRAHLRISNELGCVYCKQVFLVARQTRVDIQTGKQTGCHKDVECDGRTATFRGMTRGLRVRHFYWASCLVNGCKTTFVVRNGRRQCGQHSNNDCNNWKLMGRYHTDEVYRTAVIVQGQATRAARGGHTSNEIALRWLQRLDYYHRRCYLCGTPVAAGDNLEWEHVKPKAAGGHPWLPSNIRPACYDCNRSKGSWWKGKVW